MKKWMIGSLILVALMVVAAGVFAQTTDKEKKQNKTECTFVDKNNDGKCDICGATADACKKDHKEAATGGCAKCPSAASCAAAKSEVVPAKECSQATTHACPNKK